MYSNSHQEEDESVYDVFLKFNSMYMSVTYFTKIYFNNKEIGTTSSQNKCCLEKLIEKNNL